MRPTRKLILLVLSLMVSGTSILGQTFPCKGDLYFSTNSNAGRTNINRIFFIPFTGLAFSRDKFYTGGDFNAMGFNPRDNYIYAARINSNEIIRLKSDHTFEVVGQVSELDKLTTSAGECTPDGYYLCHDQVLDQILVFNVIDSFELVRKIDLYWDPESELSGTFTPRIDDFALDPNNPTVAYSYQGNYFDPDLKPNETRGYFLKINLDFQSPDLGMVTPIAPISEYIIRKIGALFFSPSGILYAYGSNLPGPDPVQNMLFTINTATGEVFPFNRTGPQGVNTDGCSCPYGLFFSNRVDPNFALCTDAKVTYHLTISNWFYQNFSNTSIADTLAEGMIITKISGNFNGNSVAGTGVGTNILQIDQLDIPPRSTVTIDIEAAIIELPIDRVSNQAFLTDLPENMGGEMVSDDPATAGYVGDETKFLSTAQRLESFTVDVTHPTDCINANDGEIVISAPVLVPGYEYEINMQNEKYEEFTADVIIDADNSFALDSLFPGDYRLYKITPKTGRCSFAMKDTTVAVIAPNELIKASVSTNSPICEGNTLKLTADVFPEGGSVYWKGPNGLWSADQNFTIDSVAAEQSGTYNMTFTYGYCEQVREPEVEVFPAIEARITSVDGICERDSLKLLAEGEGNLKAFTWTNPEGYQYKQQLFPIPNTRLKDDGWYEVVIDNGLCQDTARKYIQVYPAPRLELPRVIESRFCDPLILNPKVSGNDHVTYSWQPSEGLSCADCPNPAIALPLHPDYTLTVRTKNACQDSADIRILLDDDRLIYIPNVFSPNDDGVNDYFQVFPNCGVVSIDQFEIFDRFGSQVYKVQSLTKSSDPAQFWDGKFHDLLVGDGVYIWQMEITLIDGSRRSLQGEVKVFR